MSFIQRPNENEKERALSYISRLLDEARNNKEERIEDIESLEEIQKLLSQKKYGLIWEQHAEKTEETMKIKIPIFEEKNNKKISDNTDSSTFNFLLEGDNLHSLHLLEKLIPIKLILFISILLIILEIKIFLITMIL